MRPARAASVIAFGIAAAALPAPGSRGQTPSDVVALLKPFAKTVELGPQTSGRVRQMMNAQIRILKTPDEKKNLDALDEFARHYAYKVTQEKYYNPGAESGELKARPQEDSLDAVFNDIRSYLYPGNLRPTADSVSKMTVDNADYIKELGAAFDRALAGILKANPPSLVRVNAARMLAVVASTGAPAYAKTITALVADPKTPPEVLVYAYQAAEAYLAAYDPYAVGRVDATRHAGEPADVVALVRALERHVVFDPATPGGPVGDRTAGTAPAAVPPAEGATGDDRPKSGRLEAKGLTPEQVKVVRYFRRHAVRALSKVRFDTLGGKNNLPEVRPAFTLARVAVADPAVSPPPSAAEYADAVAGLCGMTANAGQTLNVDALADAIAAGSIGFGLAKVQNPGDRSLPWRITASRLAAAFADFKASVNRNAKALAARGLITSVADTVTTAVLAPLEQGGEKGGTPDVERVRAWMQQNPPKDPGRQLYNDSAAYRLTPRTQ